MKKVLSVFGGALAGLVFGLSLHGWGSETRGASPAKASATGSEDARLVKVSSELAKRARLELAAVEQRTLAPTLSLVGSIDFDANHVAEVGARIEGRVARMLVSVGDEVERGEALVEIDSAELGEAAAALLGTHANLIAAEHNERRESLLATQQLASAPTVERARAEVNALRATMHGARQRLLTMGLSRDEVAQLEAGRGPRHITLRAPLDGQVVKRNAVLGQVVDPTEPVLQIANLDSVWVELDVFERDLAQVAEGNFVDIESETHPGRSFRGRVTHMDATVDLATRTARVRVEVENTARRLRPGQFVRARLTTQGAERSVLVVPRSSVLQVEGEPSVFVQVARDTYMARPVELGVSAGQVVEVKRGLAASDLIVREGAFALKSELLR
jgi:cobalt-zinc-cadmium efflux system membrane fusion protein